VSFDVLQHHLPLLQRFESALTHVSSSLVTQGPVRRGGKMPGPSLLLGRALRRSQPLRGRTICNLQSGTWPPKLALYDLGMDQAETKRGNLLASLGIPEPDVELAKADLATRVHRLAQLRHCSSEEAAALLSVQPSELPALLQGRLATCSIDQLLRMLTWLGDDVEIVIRPRVHRTKRGAVSVFQVSAIDKPNDFESPAHRSRKGYLANPRATTQAGVSSTQTASGTDIAMTTVRDDMRLLNKHAVEKMTSLDITTIYRRMAVGTFPQPVRVGRRRVAWRISDIMRWQQQLEIGTEALRWKTHKSGPKHREDGGPHGSR
jgi:predicted DNA-binding transcriptional regulator AlpA/predicted XRE-type DNA-binding protein